MTDINTQQMGTTQFSFRITGTSMVDLEEKAAQGIASLVKGAETADVEYTIEILDRESMTLDGEWKWNALVWGTVAVS